MDSPLFLENQKEPTEEEEEEAEINPSAHKTLAELMSTDLIEEEVEKKDRRKVKGKASAASPRRRRTTGRRPTRRRLDNDEPFLLKDAQDGEGGGGRHQMVTRKRKNSAKITSLSPLKLAKNTVENFVPASTSSVHSPIEVISDDGNKSAAGVWDIISDLTMWKDVTKSTLWFGIGSTFFISCCFSRKSNFSVISAASNLGILILGFAFLNDSLSKRQTKRTNTIKFQLTEDDFLRASRLVLPLANSILAKSQEVFSGDPLMTLKVAPVLLFTAKIGPLITPWRLFAAGFFLSFTIPKLYTCYSKKLTEKVQETKNCLEEAWNSCPNKKLVVVSTATVLWNMFSVKTRIFAAFMSAVVLRYRKQSIGEESGEKESRTIDTEQQHVMLAD